MMRSAWNERQSAAAPIGFQPTSHSALSPLGNYGFFLRPFPRPTGNQLEQEAGSLATGCMIPVTPNQRTLTNHALSPCGHHAFLLSEDARGAAAPPLRDLRGRALRAGGAPSHLRRQQARTREVVQHRFGHRRSDSSGAALGSGSGGGGGGGGGRFLGPAHRAIHMSPPRPGSAAAPSHVPHDRTRLWCAAAEEASAERCRTAVARARGEGRQWQRGGEHAKRYKRAVLPASRRRRHEDARDVTIRQLRNEIADVRRNLQSRGQQQQR